MTDDRWYRRAACKGVTDPFYVERGNPNNYTKARRICANCPVQAECLDACLEEEAGERYRFGFRAGMTPHERNLEARRRHTEFRKIRAVAVCGTNSGYFRHRREREPACEDCKRAHREAVRARKDGRTDPRRVGDKGWASYRVDEAFDTSRWLA